MLDGAVLESPGRPELAGLTVTLICWPWISDSYWKMISTVPSEFLIISTPEIGTGDCIEIMLKKSTVSQKVRSFGERSNTIFILFCPSIFYMYFRSTVTVPT